MVYRITEPQVILNDESDLTEYYNGDERLPVFMRHSPTYRFTVERLCNILLDPDINLELVCKSRPTRIGHNVTFVVDCSYFPDSAISISTDDSGITLCIVHGTFMALVKIYEDLLYPFKV